MSSRAIQNGHLFPPCATHPSDDRFPKGRDHQYYVVAWQDPPHSFMKYTCPPPLSSNPEPREKNVHNAICPGPVSKVSHKLYDVRSVGLPGAHSPQKQPWTPEMSSFSPSAAPGHYKKAVVAQECPASAKKPRIALRWLFPGKRSLRYLQSKNEQLMLFSLPSSL